LDQISLVIRHQALVSVHGGIAVLISAITGARNLLAIFACVVASAIAILSWIAIRDELATTCIIRSGGAVLSDPARTVTFAKAPITDDQLIELSPALLNWGAEKVSLESTLITDRGALAFLTRCGESLTHVSFANTGISRKSFLAALDCPSLESLCIPAAACPENWQSLAPNSPNLSSIIVYDAGELSGLRVTIWDSVEVSFIREPALERIFP